MQFNPFFEIIFAAVIWGTTGVFVKFLDLPPASITFFRLFIPAIITLLILCYKRTDFVKKTNKIMVFISIVTAFRMLLYFFAFKNTSIGNAVIILYTWPVFAVLLSPIFLKEKLTGKILALSFFAFIGIITIFMNKEFSFTNNDFLGMFSMLLSAVLTALMFVVLKKQLIHYSTIETVFYQNILGVFIFLPFLL